MPFCECRCRPGTASEPPMLMSTTPLAVRAAKFAAVTAIAVPTLLPTPRQPTSRRTDSVMTWHTETIMFAMRHELETLSMRSA